MNQLMKQGLVLLLSSMLIIIMGWYLMFDHSILFGILGSIIFALGVVTMAFGYMFIKFSCTCR